MNTMSEASKIVLASLLVLAGVLGLAWAWEVEEAHAARVTERGKR